MDAQQMAGGGQVPPQQVQVAPNASPVGGDQQKILEVLSQAIRQSVDQRGYVDVQKLAQIWPQIAQQLGVNIPFETVLQMIGQNPEMIQGIITQLGLSGIIVNGRAISEQELSQMAGGQSGGGQMAGGA
jgi:hypothetical protein